MLKQAFFLILMIPACGTFHSKSKQMKIECDTLSMIPPTQGKDIQHGLAGALSGCIGNRMIVAGGSNFEDNLPWRGGTKLYHDELYILTREKDNSLTWSHTKQRLPQPMAYSANVQTDNGFISIGGEDLTKKLDLVFRLIMVGDSVQFKMLPALPVPLSNAGGALIGSKLFVAGGLDSSGATAHFLSLDLFEDKMKWINLPDLPEPLSHAVLVNQSDGKEDCIYVVGGRNQIGVTSTFLSNIWKYAPSIGQWTKAGILQLKDEAAFGLSAGTGVSFGDRWIILLGGDRGILFNKTEKLNDLLSRLPAGSEKEKLLKDKDIFLSNHPGFSGKIMAFNTITGELLTVGEMPAESQVTTTAFWWNDQVVIPSGEIRPGVRTPLIRGVKIVLE